MITREEAVLLCDQVPVRGPSVSKADLARTVVALYDQLDELHDQLDDAPDFLDEMEASVELDKARARIDDAERERDRLLADIADKSQSLTRAWDDNAGLEAEIAVLKANAAGALDAIRAMSESTAAYATKADALALELRRLREAETGTDTEAFKGTGWTPHGRGTWYHAETRTTVRPFGSRYVIFRDANGWWGGKQDPEEYDLALDAMRAAVPGSVPTP